MKKITISLMIIGVIVIGLFGYFYLNQDENNNVTNSNKTNNLSSFNKNTTVSEVINNESFKGYGNLIFPVDRTFDSNTRLDDIDDIYIWYNYINDDKTVEIVNYMKEETDSGNQIFYHIYSEEEIEFYFPN